MTQKERNLCACKAWVILIRLAQSGGENPAMTYEALAAEFGMHPQWATNILKPIQWLCQKRRIPDLTALVVKSGSRRPSKAPRSPHRDTSKWDKKVREVAAENWDDIPLPTPEEFAEVVEARY